MRKIFVIGFTFLTLVFGMAVYMTFRPTEAIVDVEVVNSTPGYAVGLSGYDGSFESSNFIDSARKGEFRLRAKDTKLTNLYIFKQDGEGKWSRLGECLYLEDPIGRRTVVRVTFGEQPSMPVRCKRVGKKFF